MKVRSRRYRTINEAPSYWPSFVDIMSTITLVFFFIMITSLGISNIFVDNIAEKRENLYNKIQENLDKNNVDSNIMRFNRDEGKIEIMTESFFDSDSSNLKEDGKKTANMLNGIFLNLLSDKSIKDEISYIEIIGHTDFAGSTIYGRTLSSERAVSFLNNIMPENSELENLYGDKFKASGMSEFENYKTKEERDRGKDEYDVEATKNDRRIEIRMVFNNRDLEDSIKERNKNKEN
ncbi:OmpA family protein [Clostridium tarantellae]|uniref:OmpA family protein n=1 Tax=Clostridium tarantellae TaxID=39493 RepID=A0A6I1MKW8_9CLOT|nr:OmpA family protein [Clostridium tarantellae]MPQ43670.1 OmpA family protein [Clostridium tarantellae]